MTSHPNRSNLATKVGTRPTAAQVRAAREKAGLTIEQAAALILGTARRWERWEAEPLDARRMDPGHFLLFELLTWQRPLDEVAQDV